MTEQPAFPELAEDLILIGYDHASILGGLRPDMAHPGRKIKAAKSCVTTITAQPCDCADERGHVEVFVRLVRDP